MSNLRLIKQVATESNVTSVSLTDVFSADYDVYCVTVAQTTYDVSNTDVIALKVRFINPSGSKISASDYDSCNMLMKAEATKDEDKFTNGTYSYSAALIGNYENAGGAHWVFNPFITDTYTMISFEGGGGYDTSSNKMRSSKGAGVLKQKTRMSGICFYSSNTANTFSAYVSVYGLRVD